MPAHIHAKEGDVASRVVICGDPARVEALSKLLERPRVVNTNRGFIAYTGKFNGRDVTIAAHGIGQPSVAIVIEELAQLGAKEIVRLGTCGGLEAGMKVGDLAVPVGATYTYGGTVTQYIGSALRDKAMAQTPDYGLTGRIARALESMRMKFVVTNAYSSDSFYSLDDGIAKELAAYGNGVVEMEAATVFMLGKRKGLKAACLLVVSDNVIKHTKLFSHSELEGRVMLAGKAVLEALTA
jgi:5'-methylthioadenosine phosphorylase